MTRRRFSSVALNRLSGQYFKALQLLGRPSSPNGIEPRPWPEAAATHRVHDFSRGWPPPQSVSMAQGLWGTARWAIVGFLVVSMVGALLEQQTGGPGGRLGLDSKHKVPIPCD